MGRRMWKLFSSRTFIMNTHYCLPRSNWETGTHISLILEVSCFIGTPTCSSNNPHRTFLAPLINRTETRAEGQVQYGVVRCTHYGTRHVGYLRTPN